MRPIRSWAGAIAAMLATASASVPLYDPGQMPLRGRASSKLAARKERLANIEIQKEIIAAAAAKRRRRALRPVVDMTTVKK